MTGPARKQAIASAISDELDRQARSAARRIDVYAMASAIDDRLHSRKPASDSYEMRQAKRPSELNASNDG